MGTHPNAATWILPPTREALPAPLERTNLRELASREGRLEHHLTVVARVGVGQLEVVAASEPLFFAHQNISDEYVIALKTGDAMVDGMPFRVFVSDAETGEDAARLKHRTHDLVLHPHGWSHWPGRLRPPFQMPPFPPGMRRTALSLVFCATRPTEPAPERRAWVSDGREADAKAYRAEGPPMLIAELAREPEGPLGAVGDVTLSVEAPPFTPPNGGWVVVLEGDTPEAFAGDLVRIPAGASWSPPIERALVVASAREEPEPTPAVWARVPDGPFAEPPEGALPAAIGELVIEGVSADEVELRLGEVSARVPRYWLARMLYRIALHTSVVDGARGAPTPCFGHVETYGGFWYDDRSGGFRFGLRGGEGSAEVAAEDLLRVLGVAYAAVAPEGHTEDLR